MGRSLVLRATGFLVAALLSAYPPIRLTAQELTATELALGATAMIRATAAYGPLIVLSRRLETRARVALTTALLRGADVTSARLGAEGQYLVNPTTLRGVALYAGGGIALEAAAGRRSRPWLTATLGVETRPGRTSGLVAELGVGGGVRVCLGVRWRRFPRWWRAG